MSNKHNTSIYERLWKLWAMICKMIMDGVRDPEVVARVLQGIVDDSMVYLRRLFETEKIVVGATDGTETFQSSGFFPGGVYGETPPVGKPTQATTVTIYEQVVDGRFAQIFESLGEGRGRWRSSGQVVAFIRDHANKLRTDGYGTFFEVEGGFVAFVGLDRNGLLTVYVRPFSDGVVWIAECRSRFVSPQQ